MSLVPQPPACFAAAEALLLPPMAAPQRSLAASLDGPNAGLSAAPWRPVAPGRAARQAARQLAERAPL
eukprot:4424481-Alexandrium_andersonii.AAC.1